MELQTAILAAEEDEIVAIGESSRPLAEWSGVERPGIDTGMIAELHCLLSGESLDLALAAYEPVFVADEGVVVLRLADELFERLAMLEHPDGAQVMFFERDGGWETGPFERPLGRGVVIQVFVTDVDAVAARVAAAGLSFYVAPFEKWRDWGDRLGGQREFLVLDPDGYLVKVAQQLGERPKP